ncbi:hypothetical protein [Aestuariimicrobium kwangyangense]|uniref:hypothetical protein n=1 Tax=Aestuariimicrobium kwangyangense TaxID=396389 RepID=UPI0003B428A1|nr:hypothetical protein [Aestuariimicrobium kwangyangense]
MSQNYVPQQQAYGARAEHPQGTAVLILAVLGFITGITQFIAWYMGGKAKKEIAAGAPYAFEGNLKTGYIIGKVLSIVAIVGFVLTILLVVLSGVLAASGS